MEAVLFGAFWVFVQVAFSSSDVLYDINNETSVVPLNMTQQGADGKAYDLYLIRTIIYEVGILTEANNDTDDSSDTQEEVTLTFYKPPNNKTSFNFENIPLPYLMNVSGRVETSIVPVNFGTVKLDNTNSDKMVRREIPELEEQTTDALVTETSDMSGIVETTTSELKVSADNETTTNLKLEPNILENIPFELLVK